MKTYWWMLSVLCLLSYQASSAQADVRFRHPRLYAQPEGPVAAVAADFNRDGVLDIASVTSEGLAAVALGRGNGTFRPARTSPIAASLPSEVYGLAALDADGDRYCDLVVTYAPTPGTCTGAVLRGLGNGKFVPHASLPVLLTENVRDVFCTDVVTADFDHDSHADILLAYLFIPDVGLPPLRSSFNVFLANGDGTFAPPLAQSLGGNHSSLAMTTADLDGDHALDLVFGQDVVFLSGPQSHTVATLLGDGAGNFPVQLSVDATASIQFARFQGVKAADLDGDGALDLTLISDLNGFGNPPGSPKNAVTLRGLGDGTFEPPVVFAQTAGANSLAMADFDCDGNPDLAVSAFTAAGGGGLLFEGEGDGSFAPARPFALSSTPDSLIAADFDADGRVDVAAIDGSAHTLAVALNKTPHIRHRCRRPWFERWSFLFGCSPLGCP